MSTRVKSGSRAVADIEQGRILASVEIAAPIERVFRALASGEIAEWWGSSDTYRTTRWTGDVRRGGAWVSEGVGADGTPFSVRGEFLEVDPPNVIVQTWVAPWDGNHTTTVTTRLDAIDGGTRVTLRHEGFSGRAASCSGHAEGWERVLGWLGKYLVPSGAGRWFLLQLVAPRATFPADITAEEAQLMGEHAAHCKRLLAQGAGVVFGPVAEPGRTWGLGVVRAESEEAVRAICEQDPVVRAGRGFRYEVLPMLSAITRD
jgi:uncharacterized protein YndB with AHSA1/START domain/uncharacterized protein YciI